jgi:DNA-binding transcriptional regulator YdaS (Cro superfamily)
MRYFSRVPRRIYAFGTLLIIGAGSLAATLATALGGSHPLVSQWRWAGGVPGTAITASALEASVASQGGVSRASLHQVAIAGDGESFLRLIAGTGPNGQICVAPEIRGAVHNFVCLDSLDPNADQSAVVRFVSEGGTQPGVPTKAWVVGISRSDVSRIEIARADGSTANAALNQWRGFSYSATSPATLPKSVSAYGSDGSRIASASTDVVP